MILALHQYMYALQDNDLGLKQSDGPCHLARFSFMRESLLGLQLMGGNGQIFAGIP